MTRLAVPQSRCAGVDIAGVRYRAKGGFLEVPDHLATHARRDLGCFTPARPITGARGFVCPSCGFHALIATCGRCGAACLRPEEIPDGHPQAPNVPLEF